MAICNPSTGEVKLVDPWPAQPHQSSPGTVKDSVSKIRQKVTEETLYIHLWPPHRDYPYEHGHICTTHTPQRKKYRLIWSELETNGSVVKSTCCSSRDLGVQFQAPTSRGWQLPVSPALGDTTPSSGFCRHLHACAHTHKNKTDIQKLNQISPFMGGKPV